MNTGALRILLTSGAGPGVSGLVAALRSHPLRTVTVIVGDVEDKPCVGFALADETCVLPFATDSQYVPKMLALCEEHRVDVIVPVFSGELDLLAESRPQFTDIDTAILLPPADAVRLANHKGDFLDFLAARDIPIPAYRRATGWDEVERALADLGYPETDLCVKPVHGTGNRGFHILRDDHRWYRRFFTEKPDNTICGLDDLRAAIEAQPAHLPELIVAEYLSGQEYGIDLLAHEGKVVDFRIRKKLPPEKLGMHFLIEFVDEPALCTLVEELSAAMALSSLVSIDVRRSASGTPCVLEVNPRPGAYIGMTCAEINLLAMGIETLLSGSPPDTAPYHTGQTVSHGIRCFHDMAFTNDSTLRAAPQSAEKGEA